ncbi:hypothetical protein ABZY09_03190 [Streptomyces sp. NPDC002928]|uniref:hypothetical protein n=1 Tax=Streptomyces sp. NPDC002928 TaxID=3154440 RepID=UPI0033AA2E37
MSSPSSSARPPGAEAPATCEVPHFAPVRVRSARYQLHRLLRHRRRAVALGLAVTAAALVAAGPRDAEQARGHPGRATPAHAESTSDDPARKHRAVETVTAPVRIADAATVRLLRPGDRVDVIAAAQTATGDDARVVARGALVTKVPEPVDDTADGGALVVLSVPRAIAARLVGAGATARLAVTLC